MYTLANMQDSIKKVEATRAQRMATEPRRMTADEKDALLAAYHPDYKEEGFITLKVGPNKGEKVQSSAICWSPTAVSSVLTSTLTK